jgi:hypothetical protein
MEEAIREVEITFSLFYSFSFREKEFSLQSCRQLSLSTNPLPGAD